MYKYVCAVLDTETTGFYYNGGDRIVELAAIKIRNGEVCENESYVTLVNPKRPIPKSVQRVHQIQDSMVLNAPLFEEVANDFLNFLSDVDYLFIHNAKFDLGFLEAEMRRLGRNLKLPKVICSVELSRLLYPQYRYHNLNAIAKNFGLKVKVGEGRHRALGDVILTGEAIIRFYEENALTFFGTLDQLADTRYCY